MEDLIKRYDDLYAEMASSKNPQRMIAFGEAEKWMFHKVAEAHPELAEKWATRLEASKWHNYLSEEEAEEIVENLEERQGDSVVKRYEWPYDVFKSAVEGMGGMIKDAPYYNCYALWVEMNTLYSDHRETVASYIQPHMRVKFYYNLAVDKLKDVDRPNYIREYFHLKG